MGGSTYSHLVAARADLELREVELPFDHVEGIFADLLPLAQQLQRVALEQF